MKRALGLLTSLLLTALAFAQGLSGPPDTLVTQEDRQRAALMILLMVMLGILLTFGLMWVLRQRGILKEERPPSRLEELQEEIGRRADEIEEG